MEYTINVDDNLRWGIGAARCAHLAGLQDQNNAPTDDIQFLNWFINDQLQQWCTRAMPTVVVAGVPQSVTRRQALQALALAGKLSLVQPAIDAIQDATQRQLMQIEWDDSLMFERQRPQLIQMAHAIGLTDAQLDDLFRTAATL